MAWWEERARSAKIVIGITNPVGAYAVAFCELQEFRRKQRVHHLLKRVVQAA